MDRSEYEHATTQVPQGAGSQHRRWHLALLTTAAILAIAWAATAKADADAPTPSVPHEESTAARPATQQAQASRTVILDQAAQSLSRALVAFSKATGIDIVVDGQMPEDREAPALKGKMTAAAALNLMLKGTGITWAFSDDKTVAISKPEASGDRLTLGTVSVEGKGPAPRQAEIGNLPPAYAGGQVARGGKMGVLGNRDFMETPFSQTSYTAKLLQDQQSQRMSDALKNDASANPVYSSAGGFDGFAIRGFNLPNTTIMFDGMPSAGPTTFNSMMSESIERVEVMKGPSAVMNGTTASAITGGSINVIPKRPLDEPLTRVTPDYTMNSQFGGHADISRRFGTNNEYGVRFNGVYRNGDTPIDFHSTESQLAALALDYRGDRFRAQADLGYEYQDLQGTRRAFAISSGVDAPSAPENSSNPYGSREYKDGDFFYGTSRLEYDVTDSLTAYLKGAANLQRYQFFGSNRTIGNSDGDLNAGNGFGGAVRDVGYFGEGGIHADVETGAINHRMTLGFGWWGKTTHNHSFSSAYSASNLYNPIYDSPPAASLNVDPGDAPLRAESSASGLTLADTLSFLNDNAHFTFGVRHQQVVDKTYDRTTGAVTASYRDRAISPLFGLAVQPVKAVTLYANYAEGLQEGSVAPTGAANAGEVFAPFVSKQVEAGAKWDMGRLAATIALFQVTQPSGFTNDDTNVYGVDGEQRNRGIELNVFGEAADGVRVLGGVTFIDAVLTKTDTGINDGNKGAGAPKVRAVVGGEWDLPFLKGLTLTGRFTYNGSTHLNPANTSKAPSWMLLDIGARYTIERQNGNPIVIRANIDNVLDSNYWNTSVSSFSSQLVLSDPRTFKLSASFDF